MIDNDLELVADIREQLIYLQELGVESLDVELSEVMMMGAVASVQVDHAAAPRLAEPPPVASRLVDSKRTERPAGSRLSELPTLSGRRPSA